MTRRAIPLTDDARYVLLAAGVLVLVLIHTLNQYWSGDFWEHAAVVRELSRRPWNPQHPLFAVDAPHPFMSPYTLMAGLTARLFGWSAVSTLALFGVFNVAALLAALRLFAGALLGAGAAFYALLFSLLLWGADPWRYSGFMHLNALGFVAAYPSITALWLTLLCLYAQLRYQARSGVWWGVIVVIGAPLVLLTHPITGMVLAIGLVAISLRALVQRTGAVLALGVAVAVASLLGILWWPHYPWLTLATTGSDIYAEPNRAMYLGVFQRTWPLLPAVLIVFKRLRSDVLDPLGWYALGLGVLFACGAWFDNGPVGRVLPGFVLTLHLALAAEAAALERHWAASASPRVWWLRVTLAGVVVLGLANMSAGIVRGLPRALLPASLATDPRLDQPGDFYLPLRDVIGPDDVVMADLNFSRHLPAFTGRVVGFIDPEAFIPDEQDRRDDVTRFFANISGDERRQLMDRYAVRFVGVDQRTASLSPEVRADLEALGRVVRNDGRLLVIERTPLR